VALLRTASRRWAEGPTWAACQLAAVLVLAAGTVGFGSPNPIAEASIEGARRGHRGRPLCELRTAGAFCDPSAHLPFDAAAPSPRRCASAPLSAALFCVPPGRTRLLSAWHWHSVDRSLAGRRPSLLCLRGAQPDNAASAGEATGRGNTNTGGGLGDGGRQESGGRRPPLRNGGRRGRQESGGRQGSGGRRGGGGLVPKLLVRANNPITIEGRVGGGAEYQEEHVGVDEEFYADSLYLSEDAELSPDASGASAGGGGNQDEEVESYWMDYLMRVPTEEPRAAKSDTLVCVCVCDCVCVIVCVCV
jgi:hypothetical protein